MKRKNILMLMSLFLVAFLMVQCNSDEDPNAENQGRLEVKMTDAPSDDANIAGTFITVADVKVDGKSLSGFSKQTIEISAYHSGNTTMLVADELEAGTYNELSLVLDYENDANGSGPGCYVLTTDGEKHSLQADASGKVEIALNKNFEVKKDASSSLVVDFDLRKSIVRDTTQNGEATYRFIAETEIKSAVRVVNEGNAGSIEGEVKGNYNEDSIEVYVYAYKKGSFNMNTETAGYGAHNVKFFNAVSSAKVNADGSYTLPFLEEGEYEVHMSAYSKGPDGKIWWGSMLDAYLSFLNSISVDAGATVSLDIDISAWSN